jgi:hypothetical protein
MWAVNAAHIGQMRSGFRISVNRWESNTKMDLREIG